MFSLVGGLSLSNVAVTLRLAGLAEIQEMSARLEPIAAAKKLLILPLHSSITLEEQSRVFEKPHVYYRKVTGCPRLLPQGGLAPPSATAR